MEHELKCWPEYFEPLVAGAKHFEYRRDDRGFAVGDRLELREWDPTTREYTGRRCLRLVTYVLRGPDVGVPVGFAVLSLREPLSP